MLKRFIEDEIKAYLKIMPVVLITGARQTGKTTLIEELAKNSNYTFVTFDDDLALSSALRDPSGWIESMPKPLIIDEVQRVPEIFLPIKKDVDQNRKPGRYILTGSANPMLLPKLGDSLAGRMGIVNMFPFSQSELHQKQEKFIENIFEDEMPNFSFNKLNIQDFHKMLLFGGFPPVQLFQNTDDVKRWIGSYLKTIMQRDVRNIANIATVHEFPRLFKLLATRSSMLLNKSEISRSLGLVNMTLKRYLHILETLFFIYLLPAWFINHGKRIIKSPKLHICDTAILGQLLEVDENRFFKDPSLLGHFLESFVFSELVKQKSWSKCKIELFHFRDRDHEVDFVLEKADGTIIGIEIKSTKTIKTDDLKGLRYLKTISKNKFKRGIILHFADHMQRIEKDIYSMPVQALWEYV
ncbi:MAG: hypothetical protein K940chlam1_01080 [Candidatus Anoxychlamydiales bacterium]|nr:hypothetical protein [Candidatus Anoxychlamydiales bacterium]